MYESYAPRDGIEDMLVAQIIAMRFLVADAMKHLVMLEANSADQEKARRSAGALSRILLSWTRELAQRSWRR